eukprot:CAMPEP_0171254476 /NCGR_PEP_ID=MMETSP0790-20130122/52253_1 /TAXON_ID=2925 /ORGANISM="Alexandrium catenella, Strain OF101" /LENGTH=303 /DNA_ID=CAMNT_0011722363 /DNA_START=17 /DNA_END=925 /DNA_ORIENTATION=+
MAGGSLGERLLPQGQAEGLVLVVRDVVEQGALLLRDVHDPSRGAVRGRELRLGAVAECRGESGGEARRRQGGHLRPLARIQELEARELLGPEVYVQPVGSAVLVGLPQSPEEVLEGQARLGALSTEASQELRHDPVPVLLVGVPRPSVAGDLRLPGRDEALPRVADHGEPLPGVLPDVLRRDGGPRTFPTLALRLDIWQRAVVGPRSAKDLLVQESEEARGPALPASADSNVKLWEVDVVVLRCVAQGRLPRLLLLGAGLVLLLLGAVEARTALPAQELFRHYQKGWPRGRERAEDQPEGEQR